MKKSLTLILLLLVVVALAACSQTTEPENTELSALAEVSVSTTKPIDGITSDIVLPPLDVSVGDIIKFGGYTWCLM